MCRGVCHKFAIRNRFRFDLFASLTLFICMCVDAGHSLHSKQQQRQFTENKQTKNFTTPSVNNRHPLTLTAGGHSILFSDWEKYVFCLAFLKFPHPIERGIRIVLLRNWTIFQKYGFACNKLILISAHLWNKNKRNRKREEKQTRSRMTRTHTTHTTEWSWIYDYFYRSIFVLKTSSLWFLRYHSWW